MRRPDEAKENAFRKELEALLNSLSMENGSDTPDWILANYLTGCLLNWDLTIAAREKWYGRGPAPATTCAEGSPSGDR